MGRTPLESLRNFAPLQRSFNGYPSAKTALQWAENHQ